MSEQGNPIRALLRREKRIYYEEVKANGGTSAWWKDWFHRRLEINHDIAAEVKFHDAALLDIALEKTWREDEHEPTDPEDDDAPDLFTVAGVPVRQVYRVRDESVPGGFLAVSCRHALITHVFGQAAINAEQAGKAQAASVRLTNQAIEMLRRANGNARESIFNVRDGADLERGHAA